jgi:hypothetical protein
MPGCHRPERWENDTGGCDHPDHDQPYERFVLTVDELGNAAFTDDGPGELARILRAVAAQQENGSTGGPVLDANGARVGSWELVRRPGWRPEGYRLDG